MTNFPILKENSSKFDKYRTSKEGVLPETIVQERKGVSKEIWISGKDGRISCHIESPSSFLKFDSNKSMQETLTNLKVWIREPNNQIRFLKAALADYNYKKQLLLQLKQKKFQKACWDWRQMVTVLFAGAGWDQFMKTLPKTNLINLSSHVTYKS